MEIDTSLVRHAVVVVRTFQVDAFHFGISPRLRWTTALCQVSSGRADGVLSASAGNLARIATSVVQAGRCSRAVRIGETVSWFPAAGPHRVSHQTIRASAQVASRGVLAYRRGVARVPLALVDILTTAVDELVSGEARAHALVLDRFADTSAAVDLVARVHTLVRLHVTEPIRRTIFAGEAFDAETAHVGIVRISEVPGWARASRRVVEYVANGVRSAFDVAFRAGIRTTALGAR